MLSEKKLKTLTIKRCNRIKVAKQLASKSKILVISPKCLLFISTLERSQVFDTTGLRDLIFSNWRVVQRVGRMKLELSNFSLNTTAEKQLLVVQLKISVRT